MCPPPQQLHSSITLVVKRSKYLAANFFLLLPLLTRRGRRPTRLPSTILLRRRARNNSWPIGLISECLASRWAVWQILAWKWRFKGKWRLWDSCKMRRDFCQAKEGFKHIEESFAQSPENWKGIFLQRRLKFLSGVFCICYGKFQNHWLVTPFASTTVSLDVGPRWLKAVPLLAPPVRRVQLLRRRCRRLYWSVFRPQVLFEASEWSHKSLLEPVFKGTFRSVGDLWPPRTKTEVRHLVTNLGKSKSVTRNYDQTCVF